MTAPNRDRKNQTKSLQAGAHPYVELAAVGGCAGKGRLMARATYVCSIDQVAKMISESLELIEVISWNSDNIDDGEMIQIYNGTDESFTTFTDCCFLGTVRMQRDFGSVERTQKISPRSRGRPSERSSGAIRFVLR